jgi:predicted transcriptional regulator
MRRNRGTDDPPTGGSPSGSSGGASASRRGAGELERAVLAVLWSAEEALSAGDVRDQLGGDEADGLSYSTVVTILSRLYDKGALTRHKDGRAFRYAPVADAAGLAARQLSALLDRQSDREAVLARFVADLSDTDEALLRELLGPNAAEGGA